MLYRSPQARLIVFSLLVSQLAFLFPAAAQDKQLPEEPEAIRVTTELVQTGVTVFDKQGKFVEGLTPEQFDLRVDGNPVKFSFFERVIAGTLSEEKLEAAAIKALSPTKVVSEASYRGRTIVFFVDDLHLSTQSVNRTRKLLTEFIDNQMGADDQAAIGSPSGQIGFLSTALTDVKPVLRAAVARINHRPYSVVDAEQVNMTEYQALRVDQGDRDTITYFVNQMLRTSSYRNLPQGGVGPPPGGPANARPSGGSLGGLSPQMAENNVKTRAQSMLRQAAAITEGTLRSLEQAIRGSSQLPGRKLLFFISDGFFLNDRNTGFGDKLKQITDAALRSGVVVYSIDAQGIVSNTDSSSNRSDPIGQLARSGVGELSTSQDPLNAVAADTGGRALLNSDALGRAITDALRETSNYYLLAWRPPTEDQKGGNFKKIEVSIVGRPDLTVRLPRGFLTAEVKNATSGKATPTAVAPDTSATSTAKGVEADLRAALMDRSPRKGLPTQVSSTFIDVPGTGPMLNAALQIRTAGLDYGPEGKQPSSVDIAGLVYNDQGKPVGGFKNRLNVNPLPAAARPDENAGVVYNHKVPLKPGIYQIRVATREERSGRVGSASHWIEIPDLASKKLTLSSLLVGGQFIGSNSKQSGNSQEQMQFSVDRRFAKGAHLNFLSIVYNAAARASSGVPELEAEIKISRGGQAIVTSPVRKVTAETGTDSARIPYGADIALRTLPAGRYLLQVTVWDRVAKTTASQQVSFEIE